MTIVTHNVLAIHKLRINVKSLAEESRIIRREIRRAGKEYRATLACHKQCRVKPESRLAQLALAFVRGKPYRTVEQSTNRPVFALALEKKLARFGVHEKRADIKRWLDG